MNDSEIRLKIKELAEKIDDKILVSEFFYLVSSVGIKRKCLDEIIIDALEDCNIYISEIDGEEYFVK